VPGGAAISRADFSTLGANLARRPKNKNSVILKTRQSSAILKMRVQRVQCPRS
jgi:hypothetical protein